MIFDRIKNIFNSNGLDNNGESVDIERDITSSIRGQVKYAGYSKKQKMTFADGIHKRIYGMVQNPQYPETVVVKFKKRPRNPKDKVTIPRSAIIPTNNPNVYVCLNYTSKGAEVSAPHSSYLALINQNIEQDKDLERKNEMIRNLDNELRRLGKDSDTKFDSVMKKIEKVGEASEPFLKAKTKTRPPSQPERGDQYR